jgi:hypothetical protein
VNSSNPTRQISATDQHRRFWFFFLVFLYYYRVGYSILAELFIMRVTSIPDTRSYQRADFSEHVDKLAQSSDSFGLEMVWFATRVTKIIGGMFNLIFLGNPILINIGFQTIAFTGICVLLLSVEHETRKRLAIFFLLPSFTLWSSIAAKEAIIVFGMCLTCAYIIRMFDGKYDVKWYHFLGMAIVYIFKARFAPALMFIIIGTWFASQIKQKGALAIMGAAFSLVLMYIFRDAIDSLARTASGRLASDIGRSLRPQFLIDKYDTFTKMPEGIWLSFVGPTATEMKTSILHLFSFTESVVLVTILAYLFLSQFMRMPIYSFVVGIFTTFWILFTNFPVGVQNPGTAIRFRTDYVILIFTVFAFVFSRQAYEKWLSHGRPSLLPRRKTRTTTEIAKTGNS